MKTDMTNNLAQSAWEENIKGEARKFKKMKNSKK